MSFDTSQISYANFREFLKQRTSQVVIWAGAGLSASAGLPTWVLLRDRLLSAARAKAGRVEFTEAKRVAAHCDLAETAKDLWIAFDHLREALGDASYRAEIRNAINPSPLRPPSIYQIFWSLKVGGFITLNLDRFPGRAYTMVSPGDPLREFDGINIHQHGDVLQSGAPFVANLHGTIDVDDSWIFTNRDFERLIGIPNYKEFIHSCFANRIVCFAGITAEDQAAGGHLDRIRQAGINLRGHYWLTNRNDTATIGWAEKAGVQIIFYRAIGSDHSELNEFLEDLKQYIPPEVVPLPILPSTKRERNFILPPPGELISLPANEIRLALNREAIRILNTSNPDKLQLYESFLIEYAAPIHNAWFISTTPGQNLIFNYTLKRRIASGSFGEVYEAVTHTDEKVALKILLGNIKHEPEVLQSFRRGVAAMKILSDRSIDGMIPYREAWEIPTCAVMELVDGPNLEDAIVSNYIKSWDDILKIAVDLSAIILSAHRVPERVLHRDIRPANILLKGYYKNPEEWKVVVLDFDLSWHRDASGGSMDLSRSINGYLAPEQVTADERKYSRNALVDSFGIGMTLFYLASMTHPLFAQHMHGNWIEVLENKVGKRTCLTWRSLPRRYARLVKWATRNHQPDRWDLTRIHGELTLLKSTLKKGATVHSAELIAEEIAARSEGLANEYRWIDDKTCAEIEMRSGYTIRITGNESDKKVQMVVEWLQTGDRKFENVKKYIGTCAEKCASELRKGGWNVWNQAITTGTCRLDADVDLGETSLTGVRLEKLSQALSLAAAALKL